MKIGEWWNDFHWWLTKKIGHPGARKFLTATDEYSEMGYNAYVTQCGEFPFYIHTEDQTGRTMTAEPIVFPILEARVAFEQGMNYVLNALGIRNQPISLEEKEILDAMTSSTTHEGSESKN